MRIFSLFIMVFVCAISAQAQLTLTVTRSDDPIPAPVCLSGIDCTLRAAIEMSNSLPSNDTINFAPTVTNITLTNEIGIDNAGTLTINGNGANVLTIDGGAGTNRIFYVLDVVITISGVTLTGGNGSGVLSSTTSGGAIFMAKGSLTLNAVNITGNSARNTGGGVVFLQGTHYINDSTFSGNSANSGGAFRVFSGVISVVNSTISSNTGRLQGGGIFSDGSNIMLRNVTITNNTAPTSGGIDNEQSALNLGNTIIAGNTATNGTSPEIDNTDVGNLTPNTITSVGYNLIGDSAGDSTNTDLSITYQPTDILDTPPLLGALQNNNGKTPTHALLFGSPAIDKGFSFGYLTDQRGLLRPVDNPAITNATGGDGSDIGAFEVQLAPTAATVSVSGYVTTSLGRGISGVNLSLTDSEGNTKKAVSTAGGYYQFTGINVGETYIISATGKRFSFSQPVQVLNVTEEAIEVNFIGSSEKRLRSF